LALGVTHGERLARPLARGSPSLLLRFRSHYGTIAPARSAGHDTDWRVRFRAAATPIPLLEQGLMGYGEASSARSRKFFVSNVAGIFGYP
jgi:hypothetical protein